MKKTNLTPKENVSRMTSLLEKLFKNSVPLDGKKYKDADDQFNKKMIEEENRIRMEERQTQDNLRYMKIEGILYED